MRIVRGAHIPDSSRREALLLRLEQMTELPLLVSSFVMIPLLVGPILWDLSPTEEATFFALDTLIWALFAVDLAFKVLVAPNRIACPSPSAWRVSAGEPSS